MACTMENNNYWQSYIALIEGMNERGASCAIDTVNQQDAGSWNCHVPILESMLENRWQEYVENPAIAARDQGAFSDLIILALAAEKARLLASGYVFVPSPPDSPRQRATITVNWRSPSNHPTVPALQSQAGNLNRIDQLLEEARQYRRANKWNNAKDIYSQVLAMAPGNSEAVEGMKVTTQKANTRMLAIIMPLMCGGMVAFIVIFLAVVLNLR